MRKLLIVRRIGVRHRGKEFVIAWEHWGCGYVIGGAGVSLVGIVRRGYTRGGGEKEGGNGDTVSRPGLETTASVTICQVGN